MRKNIKGIREVKCLCGKVPYYSPEAAESALRRARHAGQVDPDRREVNYYRCVRQKREAVWHLTSLTPAQYARKRRVAMLAAIREWGCQRDKTITIPAARFGGRARCGPYSGHVTVYRKGCR